MESDPQFVRDIAARAAQGDEACKAAARCLQAMRSVICQQNCQGSPTAYFGAAVTTLERQVEQPADSGDETTAALLLVLRKALTAVPANVVSSRLNEVVAVISAVLRKPEKEELAKRSLGCLAATADLAYDVGSRPNRKVLKPIFNLVCDSHENVRHRAQLSAASILRRGAAASDEQTMEFATQHIVQMITSARPDKKLLNEIPARHAVTLLKAVASDLPVEPLGGICEALVKLPGTLGQHPCCTEAFEFIASHLNTDDAEEEEVEEGMEQEKGAQRDPQAEVRRATLAARIFQGLLSVPVKMLNVAYVVAYVKALAAAVASLTGEHARKAVPGDLNRPKLEAISKMQPCLQSRTHLSSAAFVKNVCVCVQQQARVGTRQCWRSSQRFAGRFSVSSARHHSQMSCQ